MSLKPLCIMAVAAVLASIAAGSALAQDEECTSCRTNNFYYILVLAIIVFAVFFWWTNRHRVPKEPRQKKLDKKV